MVQNVSYYRELPELFIGSNLARALNLGKRKLNRVLNGLVLDGTIVKLRNTVYARADSNQFAIAAELYGGYIGFSSALYLHGLKTELERIVRVCVSEREKPAYFKNVKLLPIQINGQLYGTELLNGILVSTYPKTIFDMLLKPKHADFFDMYRALNTRAFKESEWRELFYYATGANLSTVRRLGFVLGGRAPGWFTKALEQLNRHSGKSFFRSRKRINFDTKWRVYDDINVKRWENAV